MSVPCAGLYRERGEKNSLVRVHGDLVLGGITDETLRVAAGGPKSARCI